MIFATLKAANSELARRKITERIYKHKLVKFYSTSKCKYLYTICLDK